MGFLIDSPALADAIVERLPIESTPPHRLPGYAGQLHWIDRQDGVEVVLDREPGTGVWRRFTVAVLSVLPIEWLL